MFLKATMLVEWFFFNIETWKKRQKSHKKHYQVISLNRTKGDDFADQILFSGHKNDFYGQRVFSKTKQNCILS